MAALEGPLAALPQDEGIHFFFARGWAAS
jgi:hypothetical protein